MFVSTIDICILFTSNLNNKRLNLKHCHVSYQLHCTWWNCNFRLILCYNYKTSYKNYGHQWFSWLQTKYIKRYRIIRIHSAEKEKCNTSVIRMSLCLILCHIVVVSICVFIIKIMLYDKHLLNRMLLDKLDEDKVKKSESLDSYSEIELVSTGLCFDS